ncbi:hypothetical protein M413DRAFT_370509 [Hebeloma cylindrosporum]|uniref:Uncharacterized protein n=1 Tax=Hebeloma cylindrosporum TaxID=76867 RepID=A0A0C3BDW3_HEBCY|nr:hypothetical protein M413DRAFT_370509 [Hebeloma cylindrosporum h7]
MGCVGLHILMLPPRCFSIAQNRRNLWDCLHRAGRSKSETRIVASHGRGKRP